jgi:glycosyltransferase involved in cell wall biosynthesis
MSDSTQAGPDPEALEPIQVPYLLVLFPVGFVRQADRWFIDPLWAKDLVEHTRYLPQLTLVSYLLPAARRTEQWMDMASVPELAAVRCVGIPRPNSLVHALWLLPRTWWSIWKEARRNVVVHSGFSWPIGEGWFLGSMQWLHRNFQVILIESANWRVSTGVPSTWRQRWRAVVYERINRFFTDRADLCIFTQPEFRDSMRRRRVEQAHVIEATWIDQAWVVSDDVLDGRSRAIVARRGGPLRLMFAGRLTPSKGIDWLVETVAGWSSENRPAVSLTIYGDGPSRASLSDAITRHGLHERVRLGGSLAYGAPFLAALAEHDALIVPSLSDEQPRVVYDAYSQGVPVIASDTPGLAQCVEHGVTGWLFSAADAGGLGRLLERLAAEPSLIASAGRAAVKVARRQTHREMHRRRWKLLAEGLAAWRAGAPSGR